MDSHVLLNSAASASDPWCLTRESTGSGGGRPHGRRPTAAFGIQRRAM